MNFKKHKSRQRGVALVIVLWMSIILTVMISSFAKTIQVTIATAGAENSLMLHYTNIDSALELTAFRLLDEKTKKKWMIPGQVTRLRVNNSLVNIRIVDPKGLIDINKADSNILQFLIQRVSGNQGKARVITKQIMGKRIQRKAPADKKLPVTKSSHMPFRHLEDLLDLPGMDAVLYQKLKNYLTVHSGQKLINPASAPSEVLSSIPGLTAPFVKDLLAKRRGSPDDKRNYTDAITRSDGLLALAERKVHIIYITAPWGKAGKSLGRRYVIATELDQKKPYRILSWSDYRG